MHLGDGVLPDRVIFTYFQDNNVIRFVKMFGSSLKTTAYAEANYFLTDFILSTEASAAYVEMFCCCEMLTHITLLRNIVWS